MSGYTNLLIFTLRKKNTKITGVLRFKKIEIFECMYY